MSALAPERRKGIKETNKDALYNPLQTNQQPWFNPMINMYDDEHRNIKEYEVQF